MEGEISIVEAVDTAFGADAIAAFVGRHWAWPVVLADPRFYEWQLRRTPAGPDRSLLFLSGDGELVGFMGIHARPFWLLGEKCTAAETTTWVIAPEARGRGLAARMFATLQERYDVIFGGRGTELSFPAFLLAGFKRIHQMPRFVRILDRDALAAFSSMSPLGERLEATPSAGRTVYDVDAWDDLTLPEEVAGDLALSHNHLDRSPEYLAWRYTNHPVFRYRGYRVSAGGSEVYLIVRTARAGEAQVMHVCEFVGARPGWLGAIAFLDDLGREHGVAMLDFYCTATDITGSLWANGWFSTVDDRDIRVADRLHPPELQEPCTTSNLLWARHETGAVFDTGRLYLTKGDLDLDRPPIAYVQDNGWRSDVEKME